jgi:hypothetical protein
MHHRVAPDVRSARPGGGLPKAVNAAKVHVVLGAALLALTLAACHSDQGPAAPVANAKGIVFLYLEDASFVEHRAGTRVSIEGTAYATVTDDTGRWAINGIPAGVYTIVAERPGFGYTKLPDVDLTMGGSLSNVGFGLHELPSFTVTSVQLELTSDSVTIRASASATAPIQRAVEFYFGKSEPIYDSASTWLAEGAIPLDGGLAQASINLALEDFAPLFAHGDTVHIAAYPANRFTSGYYSEQYRLLVKTSGIGPVAARTSFVLP